MLCPKRERLVDDSGFDNAVAEAGCRQNVLIMLLATDLKAIYEREVGEGSSRPSARSAAKLSEPERSWRSWQGAAVARARDAPAPGHFLKDRVPIEIVETGFAPNFDLGEQRLRVLNCDVLAVTMQLVRHRGAEERRNLSARSRRRRNLHSRNAAL